MPVLSSDLRNKLERAIIEAREVAEVGSRAALEAFAVHHHEPYPHQTPEQRKLRNHLRARARQLGDRQDTAGRIQIDHLVHECAYEYWHRILFARFLAENGLLIEPKENIAISLAEAEELAKEEGEDVWVFASRCAQGMLPQIFRPDDPLLHVAFATEHRIKLEKLLASLPEQVFTATDALGWVYQFWQSKKKDDINLSGVKIGADEISAVTQLFTEPYMVEFLLHNTLGAWWAGKTLTAEDAASAGTEDELRQKLSLPGVGWEYLRFVQGTDGKGGPWRPAAGTFDGWSRAVRDIKILDPCCGSGHFLVAALHHLVPIRMAEEGLSVVQALDAVLYDNLHGLEIDERCCQIAAFALAFAAWIYPDSGGYRPLPEMHIACTGIGPQATEDQWLKLAEATGMPSQEDQQTRVKNGLLNLHRLFSQAPTLGSLINPKQLKSDVFATDYETIRPYLVDILLAEKADDETRERAISAAGMVKASYLLSVDYTLVITNVPYLGRGKQDEVLQEHSKSHFTDAKADLATTLLLRCLEFCQSAGSVALVMPQNWLFLGTYRRLRTRLLKDRTWHLFARLGANAFQGMNWWAATTSLVIIGRQNPSDEAITLGIDVSVSKDRAIKSNMLKGVESTLALVHQRQQLENPDSRILLEEPSPLPLVGTLADYGKGSSTGDGDRLLRQFWEVGMLAPANQKWLTSTRSGLLWSGRRQVTSIPIEHPEFQNQLGCRVHGQRVWGRPGLAIKLMNQLTPFLYDGEVFDNNTGVLAPHHEQHLSALVCWCQAGAFREDIRKLDQKLYITPATLGKVPFDLAKWQKVAETKYPDGLPEPESDDPTQWLFHGLPEESNAPLLVAVARLLGYRWPAELDAKMHLSARARGLVQRCDALTNYVDDDGIVCIPSVRGEETAAERLQALLTTTGVKPAKVRELAGGSDLADWLRNAFFEEHCKLFHDRPFVWHIWDGRKRDGFHALVNYHRLTEGGGKGRKLLESLTYAYLGDWISRQQDGVKHNEEGSEYRLVAAMELQKRLIAILEGEPPFDLFVRWKPLYKQPIGWEPDINDGVRINIRPFLASDLPNGRAGAGILRWKPNTKWEKDRGKEQKKPKADFPWLWGWDGKTVDFLGGKEFTGVRFNACHYTVNAKRRARETQTKGGI